MSGLKRFKYTLELRSPVIIPDLSADENIVASMDYIPGSIVWGVAAARIIKKKDLGNEAHKNDSFRDSILEGGVSFGPAFPSVGDSVYYPAPVSLGVIRDTSGKREIMVDRFILDKDTSVKPVRGFMNYLKPGEFYSTGKRVYFHNTRKDNRAAGCSTNNSGDIFNYEALNPGEEFTGYISGEEAVLIEIKRIFDENHECRIGKSRGTQYGSASIKTGEPEDVPLPDITDMNSMTVTFITPVIPCPGSGINTLHKISLKKLLEESGINGVRIDKAFLKSCTIETYSGVWKMRRPSQMAWSAGSSVRISFTSLNYAQLSKALSIGIGDRNNVGFGRINILPDNIGNSMKKSVSGKVFKPEQIKGNSYIKEVVESVILSKLFSMLRVVALKKAEKTYNIPPRSLISRLIIMMKKATDISTFEKQMISLSEKRAGDNLNKCLVENESLFSILACSENQAFYFKNIIQTEQEIFKGIVKDSGCSLPEIISSNEVSMYKEFWISYFRLLRKISKEGDNNE